MSTMIPQRAIELAIEGGWVQDYFIDECGLHDSDILLDPAFWQSLGKALGAEEPKWHCKHYNPKANDPGERGCASDFCEYAGWPGDWHTHWHRFIDALADGTTDQFWDDLLPHEGGDERV